MNRYIENSWKIVVLAGAGISTNSGIPDFRTPGTGLWDKGTPDLPYPEAVFTLSYFRKNQEPFYTLMRSIFSRRFDPTLSHAFIRLLDQKNKLLRCFTQNIDGLEISAGLPPNKIVEAHGSLASSRCIDCRAEVSHN